MQLVAEMWQVSTLPVLEWHIPGWQVSSVHRWKLEDHLAA